MPVLLRTSARYTNPSERKDSEWRSAPCAITAPNRNSNSTSTVTARSPPISARAGRSSSRIRSEEHTSELQSLMRISYAVFCLKKKIKSESTEEHNTSKQQQTTRQH